MYSAIAATTASCVAYASRSISSALIVAKKLSATALSQQSPLRLLLATMLRAASAPW